MFIVECWRLHFERGFSVNSLNKYPRSSSTKLLFTPQPHLKKFQSQFCSPASLLMMQCFSLLRVWKNFMLLFIFQSSKHTCKNILRWRDNSILYLISIFVYCLLKLSVELQQRRTKICYAPLSLWPRRCWIVLCWMWAFYSVVAQCPALAHL